MNLENFKPNLIPNNPKDGSFDIDETVMKHGGYEKYFITMKKDGCRLQLIDGKVLTRALKKPRSKHVIDRFTPLAKICKKLNITLDGEFYQPGLDFGQIYRFFSKEDVTTDAYKKSLAKELAKSPKDFVNKYRTLDMKFLTSFSEGLYFWLFDGIVLDRPDLIGYEERLIEIMNRLSDVDFKYLEMPTKLNVTNKEELYEKFQQMLDYGFEGLVLTHKDHKYKFGRNTLQEGTLLKMKNDALEYDGVIIDIVEGTKVKEGIEKTTNELGRSRTSKKKEDREPSGLAKGFLVEYLDKGTFLVGLKDFSNNQKRHLLEDKTDYIGKCFRYTAMKPVRDFPRHAYFSEWRDEK